MSALHSTCAVLALTWSPRGQHGRAMSWAAFVCTGMLSESACRCSPFRRRRWCSGVLVPGDTRFVPWVEEAQVRRGDDQPGSAIGRACSGEGDEVVEEVPGRWGVQPVGLVG